jgi:hypothetical protein
MFGIGATQVGQQLFSIAPLPLGACGVWNGVPKGCFIPWKEMPYEQRSSRPDKGGRNKKDVSVHRSDF